ncbi:hypothetical protein LSAT2_015217 [Lamellibrachia satsuma]|nr:hypothetical protein LSAT2_015217 [Lamellibrachia satsuma]
MYYPDQHRNSYYNGTHYPEEVRVRDDSHRRSSNRRESRSERRHSKHHHQGHPRGSGEFKDPNFNMAKYGAESHRRNTMTVDEYRRRSVDMALMKRQQWTPEKLIGVFMLFVLTVLVLGSIAIGGAALYYAHLDSPLDPYLTELKFTHEIYTSDMGVPTRTAFTSMQTRFCKGVNVVFGSELKSCEVDGLQNDNGVVVHGRLGFYRRTLESAAKYPGSTRSQYFIKTRLEYACHTQFICSTPIQLPVLLPIQVRFAVKSNFSSTTTQIGDRNDTNFIAAQASVCDAVKVQLGSVYAECYVKNFETGTGGQTVIVVTVDHVELRDKTKKDSASLTKGALGSDHMADELMKLINKGGGRRVAHFSNLVLTADVVELYLL